ILSRAALATAPFPLPSEPARLSQYWLIKKEAGDKPSLPLAAFQIFALDVYDDFIGLLDEEDASSLPQNKEEIIRRVGVQKFIRNLKNLFRTKPFIAKEMLKKLRRTDAANMAVEKKRLLTAFIKTYQDPDSRYLNFYGPVGTVDTIPYFKVIDGGGKSSSIVQSTDLKGKTVFIGPTELRSESKDRFHTVFGEIRGVEIAATAFANLLEVMPVQPTGLFASILIVFLWGVAIGFLCFRFPTLIAVMGVVGLSLFYLITVQYRFINSGSWYPLLIPLFVQAPLAFFGTVLWKSFHISKERQNITKAVGYYLPDDVVEQLAENMADIQTGGQIVYGTCLSTDAEQYTAISETMDPKALSSFMNKYYEAVFEPVKQRKGIVSDVVGDSMLAIWATALPDASLRNEACHAALEISRSVHKFNLSSNTGQLPTRIGLHSGNMVLGNIGAIDHYEYRPVGEIVSTVSRIESLNKYLGTRILASEEVLHHLDGFLTRELGNFLLVGKSKPISIYELICRIEESDSQKKILCNLFPEALNAYKRQSWDEAIRILSESVKTCKEDGPSLFYLKICEQYRKNPPETWDGVFRLDKK
ncbi:CHASE2 domain-containing protein, partial [Thermodesulfobacteriota bacterium]